MGTAWHTLAIGSRVWCMTPAGLAKTTIHRPIRIGPGCIRLRGGKRESEYVQRGSSERCIEDAPSSHRTRCWGSGCGVFWLFRGWGLLRTGALTRWAAAYGLPGLSGLGPKKRIAGGNGVPYRARNLYTGGKKCLNGMGQKQKWMLSQNGKSA